MGRNVTRSPAAASVDLRRTGRQTPGRGRAAHRELGDPQSFVKMTESVSARSLGVPPWTDDQYFHQTREKSTSLFFLILLSHLPPTRRRSSGRWPIRPES